MKKLTAILLAVICLSTLTACKTDNPPVSDTNATTSGITESSSPIENNISVSAITAEIIEKGEFPEMMEQFIDTIEGLYFGIDIDNVVEASLYMNPASIFSDEIIIIKMSSSAKANETKAVFEERVQGRIKHWEKYLPSQLYKVEEAIIKVKGEYIALFICDDSDGALKIFEENV
ncbi:MAG: DUF4358 domain-containing protein [Oscillospiraceae bacterium]|nr:DUF4358 domain-containing protein [Oscillospiraceae bacterium]